MHIIHPINDFLFELFPKAKEAGNNIDVLKQEIETFYTVGPFKPAITIVHGIIDITIEGELIEKHNSRYSAVLALFDAHQYNEAKEQISRLIREAPHISEYHRILGQILSEQGDQDDAINSLIDALRWDQKNQGALILTGNIMARFQLDLDAALKYYACAVQHKPDDYVSMTLIAINLIQNGNPDVARQYLDRAFAVNPAYPNIYYAFALLAEAEHNSREAFEMSVVALFKNPKKDPLYQQSLKMAMKAASEIIDEEAGSDIVNSYASMLEEECGQKIVIEADAGLKRGAKIEFAENHDRSYHLVKYNPDYPVVHHLIMHELTHLLLAAQARQAGKNKRFVSDDDHKKRFLISLEHDARKLSKKGYDDEFIKEYYTLMFQRLNEQIFNTPIGLYIEDYLFRNYPALMPYQFLSLLGLIQEGIHATNDEQILTIAPPDILSKAKSFNLVNALHLLKRYGVNLIEEHQPTTSEKELAERFYREYEECRTRHTPGDEYELLQRWAKQLSLHNYFLLIEEPDYRVQSDLIERLCAQAKVDLPGKGDALSEATNPADKKMPLFNEVHQGKDINMAVTRFMVEALHYFKNLTDSEVNDIAIQIGPMCGEGINPNAEGYTIPLIAGKTFTGYQVLAYYYVSWAKAFPDYLQQLQLPFEKEYEFAREMVVMGGN
jgi:Flp pilus assembly protein TadD